MTEPRERGSFTVGTAGHIDHGKSALVKALTQIDPDRLEEEKRRGMTIDLGFAYMDLPSGRHLGIVDVPGHQRFLKNMLAGVHGMDAVLLVIAADEGPMPQTREHLAIIDLLGINHGLVVLTKVDLVSSEWLRLVREEVAQMLAGSPFGSAPVVPVSSTAGQGLDELRLVLDKELDKTVMRPDLGQPRLPVDRAFAMSGFGTVVTGTLVGGSLRLGQELALLPAGRRLRIRGLQQHNRPVEEALPGSRTAVNIAGADRSEVRRGDVLVIPGMMGSTRRMDARLSLLGDAPHPLRHRARLLMYHETAEIPVEISLLDADQLGPGERGWAQIYTLEPAVALPGDRFILRLPSPAATLAGGLIVDTSPRRHRRRDPSVLEDLRSKEGGDPALRAQLELAKHPHGMEPQALSQALGISVQLLGPVVDALVARGTIRRLGPQLVAREAYLRLALEAGETLAAFHGAEPLRRGMPKEALRKTLGLIAPAFHGLLQALEADGILVETPTEVALSAHRAEPSPEQRARVEALRQALELRPFSPPLLEELMHRYQITTPLVQHLVAEGEIVRVSDDVVFSKKAVEQALMCFRDYLRVHPGLSVAAARDLLQSSRRYVLPLLEWFDAEKITRRVGDDRILRD